MIRIRLVPLLLVILLVAACASVASCGKAGEGLGFSLPNNDFFGIHLQPQYAESYDRYFNFFDDLNAGWTRTNLFWYQVEPQAGEYDWKDLDGLVKSAGNHGLKVLFTIRAISPWGSSRLPPNWRKPGYHAAYPPKDMSQYSAFVGALASHFKGQGVALQVENEPNATSLWGGTRDEYIALLKAAYGAAHAADPDAVVLSAGLACGVSRIGASQESVASLQDWFVAILDSRACDAVDVHDYYPPQAGNAWGVTFEQYLDTLEGWMKESGVSAPVWITEVGASSAPVLVDGRKIPFTESDQAKDLKSMYDIARKHGVAHVFWLKLVDTPEGDLFSHMGLLESNMSRKPAWDTYRRLALSPGGA